MSLLLALLLAGCGCQPAFEDSVLPEDSRGPVDSLPPEDSDEPVDTGTPGGSIGLLSLNLHCLRLDGTSFGDNQARMEAIAAAVVAEDVRVVALQELCVSADTSAPALLEAALEQASAVPWTLLTAYAHTGWEGTEDEAEEYLGLAVQGEVSGARELVFHVQDGLRRVGVQGLWDPGMGPVAFASVHLDHQHAEARAAQARQAAVEALVSSAGASAVVAGDFNDSPGSAAPASLEGMGFEDPCIALSGDRIDYVWLHRGAALTVESCARVFTGDRYPEVSDHPGILVRVRPRVAPDLPLTTVRTRFDAGGSYLALRGEQAPLSWHLGWPASQDGDGWTFATTELDGSFAYKWLLDDAAWQQGDNLQGQAGQVNEGSVRF